MENLKGNLLKVMHGINSGCTGYFNRKYSRRGHLFQGRCKVIIFEKDFYLVELRRYIHLNPVRAEIVQDLKGLNKYPYCGHSVLVGKQKRAWHETGYVLCYFGKTLTVS